MDLEVARADRHGDAVPVAAGGGEGLRDGGLRNAEEPQNAPLRSLRARRAARRAAASRAHAARAPAAHAAGPGAQLRRSSRCRGRPPARCRRARPTRLRRAAPPACARRARSRCRDGSAARRPGARVPRSRGPAARRPRSGRPAARASSSIVRSSCVGPRPPETTSRSSSSPARKAASSSAGSSPTTVIRTGSTPSRSSDAARYGPFRSCRSPRTSSEPDATMLALRRRANRWT